jgi:lysophospholipase L1-like esterase
MRAMIGKLSDNGVKSIILATLNPIIEVYVKERHPQHPRRADLQGCLTEYDQVIRKVAGECGCALVDLRKIIMDNGGPEISPGCLVRCEANGGGRDGVHLVASAYEELGKAVGGVLKSVIRGGETIVCFGDSLTYGVHVVGEGKTEGGSYPAVLQRMLNSLP